MKVTRLRLRDFRSYEDALFDLDPSLTVLLGPNAIGKTNAIEALQILTAGVSFRRPKWEDLVRWGAESATAEMTAEAPGRSATVRLDVDASGSRSFRVNGAAKRRVSDVTGIVPSVVFTPEDLVMVKGPAERRRDEIDALGEQLSVTYRALGRDYARVVRQRNAALKEDPPDERALAAWDEQLVALGAKLTAHRRSLLGRVGPAAAAAYAEIAEGETLGVAYEHATGVVLPEEETEPTAVAAALAEALEKRAGEERARRVTLVGPHRDDIGFRVEGRAARSFASQGQQRSVALAWKLAEVAAVESVTGKKPLLLLDDVMSELDERRREALTSLVAKDVQTVVTTTNLGYFSEDMMERARVVTLQ